MENNKSKKDKEILKEFHAMCERLGKTINMPSSKKVKYIKDLPRKYKLSEEERLLIPQKFENFIEIQKTAIMIITKYIKEFSSKPEYKVTVEDLKNGLNVLEIGMKRDLEEGVEGLIANLERFKKGKRPGLSLSRGFGEFLWQGYPWQDEIMDAVYKIEDYWRNI